MIFRKCTQLFNKTIIVILSNTLNEVYKVNFVLMAILFYYTFNIIIKYNLILSLTF